MTAIDQALGARAALRDCGLCTTLTSLEQSRCWGGRWERRSDQQDGHKLSIVLDSAAAVEESNTPGEGANNGPPGA